MNSPLVLLFSLFVGLNSSSTFTTPNSLTPQRKLTFNIETVAEKLKDKLLNLDVDDIPLDHLSDLVIKVVNEKEATIDLDGQPLVFILHKEDEDDPIDDRVEIIFDNKSINSQIDFRKEYEVPTEEEAFSNNVMDNLSEFLSSVLENVGDYIDARDTIANFIIEEFEKKGLVVSESSNEENQNDEKKTRFMAFSDEFGNKQASVTLQENIAKFVTAYIRLFGNEFEITLPNGEAANEVNLAKKKGDDQVFQPVLSTLEELKPKIWNYPIFLKEKIKKIFESQDPICKVLDVVQDKKKAALNEIEEKEENEELAKQYSDIMTTTFNSFCYSILGVEEELSEEDLDFFKKNRKLAKGNRIDKAMILSTSIPPQNKDRVRQGVQSYVSKRKFIALSKECEFCNDSEEQEFNNIWNTQLKPQKKQGRKLTDEKCIFNTMKVKASTYAFSSFQYIQISFEIEEIYSLEMAFKIDSQDDIDLQLDLVMEEIKSDFVDRETSMNDFDKFAKLPENKGLTVKEVDDLYYQQEGIQRPNVDNIQNEIIKKFNSELKKKLTKSGEYLLDGKNKIAHVYLFNKNEYVKAQFYNVEGKKNSIMQEITVPVEGSISGWKYFQTTLTDIINNIKEERRLQLEKGRISV